MAGNHCIIKCFFMKIFQHNHTVNQVEFSFRTLDFYEQ